MNDTQFAAYIKARPRMALKHRPYLDRLSDAQLAACVKAAKPTAASLPHVRERIGLAAWQALREAIDPCVLERIDNPVPEQKGTRYSRDELNPANRDKPCTTRQARVLVRFADKRYRINLYGIEQAITRGEAHDALAVVLAKTGAFVRGDKKKTIEELRATLDEYEARTAGDLEFKNAIEVNARFPEWLDSELDNDGILWEIDRALWSVFEDDEVEAEVLVEYDEPIDLDDAIEDEPAPVWTFDPVAATDAVDHALTTRFTEWKEAA